MSSNEHLRTSKGNNDECYTKDYGVMPLLEFLPPFKDKIIWCPFDTEESQFVKILAKNGYNVVNSHIWNGQIFFYYEPEKWDFHNFLPNQIEIRGFDYGQQKLFN